MKFPLLLIGSDYWNPLLHSLRATMNLRGCISETDLNRFMVLGFYRRHPSRADASERFISNGEVRQSMLFDRQSI